MGAVYKAEDTALGNRLVALKEMSMASLYPQEVTEAAEMFKQEALMLAKLHHPHLPSIYEHFSEAGRWYLVMSFIEGESLEQVLEKRSGKKLPVPEVVNIGNELCGVLDYLHTQRPPIIFRDLKPSNIMKTKRGDIYLIDFGIARHFTAGKARDTTNYGSPGYASPEQFSKQTTTRSDIYSLGATLHRLLSGYDPSDSPFRLPSLHSLGVTVPSELEELIVSMLDMDPDRRPASMTEVKQRLQRMANPALAQSTLPPARERKPAENPELAARSSSSAPTQYAARQQHIPPTQYAPPSSALMPSSHPKLSHGKVILLTLGTILGFLFLSFVIVGVIVTRLDASSLTPIVVIGVPEFILGMFLIRKCTPKLLGKWFGGLGGLVGLLLFIVGLIQHLDVETIAGGIVFLVSILVFLLTFYRKKYP
ncbi:hypothetical protein KSZ_56900 [Dictyobacter formicarum]|uniref:non-specific serine/threonine protein kinase n=2 Tax=Dictyobacter formicarum TaxID=2778368 RepID=A0ABQ3VPT1_9CHLR|nr:hypothetical protein KSZ_56900 [Dictyobacter formicarum]